MAPEETAGNGRVERRGMDQTVLAVIRGFHENYTRNHDAVHEAYVTAHEREHSRTDQANHEALELAALRLREMIASAREYYGTVLEERDRRYGARFEAGTKAVDTALTAAEKAVDAAFEAREKALAAALEAAEKAILKSEVAQEKRADATFVTVAKLQDALGQVMPRSESETRFSAMAKENGVLTSRVQALESERRGSSAFGKDLIAYVTIAILAIGLLLAYFRK